ncbi:RNA 2'-phosphotransferase [Nonlabens ulvanivorans]|uniref:RNA 2'-phosphotransferase n=1 Tax=Nonlabens ulvanivorans TaxID=906888 RepID=UPI002941C6CC|nr:RNA 2'-phosphotransferase [Nonlabens ulvanivorans]WOI21946.1 RNA 2'-phosphotransferase [Nonlabens ulvanivorans]
MNYKKISKLISYWLRHKPEEVGLVLDSYGWACLSDLLEVLESNGIELTINDLLDLNSKTEKIRWEIDIKKNRVKATHGHSISIKNELLSTIPEVEIYHGTSIENYRGIVKEGIRSKSRQYVHLTDSIEMAKKIGSRHGKPILFEIDAISLIKDGWSFYRTEQNVWLTTDIPVSYVSLPPFDFNLNQERIDYFSRQLRLEVKKGHKLFNEINDLIFFTDYAPREEVYFINKKTDQIHCVHFTFGATNDHFPSTTSYESTDDWLMNCLLFEQDDWFLFRLD